MKKYRKITPIVKAIQFTGGMENIDHIFQEMNEVNARPSLIYKKDSKTKKETLSVDYGIETDGVANLSDYLIINTDRNVNVMSKHQFEREYEEVDDE